LSTTPDVTGGLLAAAHVYRNRGWRVIPLHRVIQGNDLVCSCRAGATCGSKGKHPLDNAWQNTAAMSGADLEASWTRPGHSKDNIGIATGAPSGVWVLDLDIKADKPGIVNFGKLLLEREAKGLPSTLPETYTVRTGSGGFHYYWEMPHNEDVANSQDRVAKGVDVRGTGGQVVAAPSVSDKGEYVVVRDVRPAQAPEWLLDLIRKPEHEGPVITTEDLPKPEDIDQAEWERLTAYAKRAIDSEIARLDKLAVTGWEGEPWDRTTFEAACSLIEFANSPWNAYSLGQAQRDVYTHAPRDRGFDDAKVAQKWQSAIDKVGNKARAIPESRSKPRDDDFDLFDSPDVRGASGPTEGGGEPTTPAVGHGSPARFFCGDGGKELDATRLSREVAAMGPIGWGRDEDFWSYEGGVWRSDRKVVRRRMTQLLGYKYRSGQVPTIEDILKFQAVQLEGDPVAQFVNFENGMLDWQTGEVLDHDPSYKSTIQLPINYEPTAQCPTFDRFLESILHPDYVRLAWEMLGYLMYSGNPEPVAFLFYGSGQNGKGTLIRVIERMLGRYNIAHESLDQINKSAFSTVNLYGKIANIAGDIDSTYQEVTANFKKITGEDVLGAERKFGDRFEFENWAVPLFSANEIPGSADVSEGYLRRWVMIHFHRHIEESEKITGLDDLLALEIEGIAAKAIGFLRKVRLERGFTITGEAAKGREEFAETIDQVRQWVRHGGPRVAPDHMQALSEIYFEYTVWANKANQKPLREQGFSRRLAAIGYPAEEAAGVVYHKGLRVSSADRHSTPNDFL
jgi:putative DNA primase/helicase